MFNWLDKPKLPILKAETVEGQGRHYTCPNGMVYPSITTILGYKKQKDLQGWINKVGKDVAEQKRNHGARRGNSLHDMIEKYIANDPKYLEGVQPRIKEMFLTLKPHIHNINNVWYGETAVYSEKLGTAGRLDLMGEWNGELAILDFKGATRPRKIEHVTTYFMQLAGYSACIYELTGVSVTKGVILMGVEDKPCQIFEIKTHDYILPLIRCIEEYKKTH